jgi:hypothetical protein
MSLLTTRSREPQPAKVIDRTAVYRSWPVEFEIDDDGTELEIELTW